MVFASPVSAISCDSGSLTGGDSCNITSSQDITGEETTGDSDIIVKSGGRLYTDHKKEGNSPRASVSLDDADFIVKSGGAVHANINISAYNIRVEEGGVLDASGLGWQSASSNSGSCNFGSSSDGFCFGGGPGGGVSGDGNSNTGAGGGGHGGKGGSYKNGEYYGHGGGYGSDNSNTYGTSEDPSTFGSGGGAQIDTYLLSRVDNKEGHGSAGNYGGELRQKILNATDGNGNFDDPDQDPLDSDAWIETNDEYRKNNPNDIRMGSGGGTIKLVASNKVNITGNVLSNGLDGGGSFGSSGYSPGGGAGGSIWISSGGIFGDGEVRADGGTYMEKIDRGQDAFGGGGGGGHVYYEYSIKDESLSVTADPGPGSSDLPNNGWGGNANSNQVKEEESTKGTVESQIAFSAFINQSIVNTEEPIKVNGTASSTVTVKINGTAVGETEPRSSDGFYNITVNSLDINEKEDLGNYTMEVSSTISGNTITETFQISHRNIQVQQFSDYILKPSQILEADSILELVKEDGSGATETTDYAGEEANWTVLSSGNEIYSQTFTTNSTGGSSLSADVPFTKGRKYYRTEAENANGIEGLGRKNISLMDINDTILDPGQKIGLNGTAHNRVEVYLENRTGGFESRLNVTPGTDGYFETSVKTLQIEEEQNLGNYTLKAMTRLNGQIRQESWNISLREIEIDNQPDFLLKPGEDLSFSNSSYLIKRTTDQEDQTVYPMITRASSSITSIKART
ncbi:hypothetical protein AQV86_04785 [Nanohaloarchaea archaeon SG9]|nr:hypothetical protein AQV86_04785 [Nanohaloarchaea archaeon SG9]